MRTKWAKKLRWAFSNRVVATPITANEVGCFAPGDFLKIGREIRRVHGCDLRSLVLYVY